MTLLTLTGFVAVSTFAAAVLSSVSGFGPAGVIAVLVGYGAATVAGNVLAGRVRPEAIPRILPVSVGVVAFTLLAQGPLSPNRPTAAAGMLVLGGVTFVVVPLVQTWLMGRVDAQAAAWSRR